MNTNAPVLDVNLLVEDSVLIELKTVRALGRVHRAQGLLPRFIVL